MICKKNIFGFSLIELMVVIAVIGILSTLSIVAYGTVRQRARDTARVKNIQEIQSALKLYFYNESSYPESLNFGGPLVGSTSSTTYMAILPHNPAPRADGECENYDYIYTWNNTNSYTIHFCLSEAVGNLTAGQKCAIPTGTVACYLPPLSNLKLWLKADAGVIKDGSNLVSSWADQSGNGNNAAATGSARPLFVSGQVNLRPVIRFDGTDDFMSLTEIADIRTVFLVIKHKTGTSATYEPILGHTTRLDFHGNTGTGLFGVGNTSAYITNGQGFVNGATTTPGSMVKPTAYSIISLVTTDNVVTQRITNDRDYGRFWNGDYAEILLYSSALSNTDRLEVEQYLNDKYHIY
jgi:prepilin-type N-terminal cleavage/methylation domain-containing protein